MNLRASPATSVRYQAEPAEQLAHLALGPVDALYHRRSGATHLVAAPVPQIIAILATQGPADLDTLLTRLAAQFDLGEQGEEARAALGQRLDELVALGLVRTAPVPD